MFRLPLSLLHLRSLARGLSLTPEFKTRFRFPLERLDQILDGTYSRNNTWVAKWNAYLLQFHKLRIDQIKDMIHLCAKRGVMPQDILRRLRTVPWTEKLTEATGRELATVLYSIAILESSKKLGKPTVCTEPFFRGILKQVLQRKDIEKFSNISLSQSIYAFALLELRNHAVVKKFSAEIAAPYRQSQLTTQTVANVLWTWAKLDYIHDYQLRVLSNTAVEKRHKANGQELTNILWAWSVLRHTSEANWTFLMEEVSSRPADFTAQGFALIFSSCARAGFRDVKNLTVLLQYLTESKKSVMCDMNVLTTVVWSLGKIQFPVDNSYLSMFIAEAVKPSRLEDASVLELARLSIGLAQLKWQEIDHCALLQEEVTKIPRMNSYDHQTLSNFIWSIGKQPFKSMDIQRALAAQLRHRRENLEQFSNQMLVSVVVGWSYCQFPNCAESNVLLREIMKKSRLDGYSSREFANLCWGFGRLRIRSWNIYTRVAESMLRDEMLPQLTPRSIANTLVGWAHGRFTDHGGIRTLMEQLVPKKLPRISSQEIANVAWALGTLKFQNQAFVLPVALEAVRSERLREYTPLQMSTILLGWAKSHMHVFHLWDRILAEFSVRRETIVIDLPILHNLNVAMGHIGFKSVNAYRSAREKGDLALAM